MKRYFAIPLLALASMSAGAADAIPSGARLAATCTGCHGTNGATLGSSLPPLAGQPKETMLAALKAFKAGTRPATIMTQLAKGYTDEQLDQIATYFASQKSTPASTKLSAGFRGNDAFAVIGGPAVSAKAGTHAEPSGAQP